MLWDYSFTFHGAPDAAYTVTFNEEQTVEGSIVLEDANGIAQIRATASSGKPPLVLLPTTTLVMSNGTYRYRTSDGTLLPYADAEHGYVRTVVFGGLHVIDVQSAHATVQEVSFENPYLPFINNEQVIEIGAAPASIGAHLTSLLHTLLNNSPFASQSLTFECRYAYTISGVPVDAPILLFMRQDVPIGFDEQLIDQITSAIDQWREAIQPPTTNGRFVFSLTLWNATPHTDSVLLRLGKVTLPMSAVV